jgi:hypothetical protein
MFPLEASKVVSIFEGQVQYQTDASKKLRHGLTNHNAGAFSLRSPGVLLSTASASPQLHIIASIVTLPCPANVPHRCARLFGVGGSAYASNARRLARQRRAARERGPHLIPSSFLYTAHVPAKMRGMITAERRYVGNRSAGAEEEVVCMNRATGSNKNTVASTACLTC